jgi:hypothetical protein
MSQPCVGKLSDRECVAGHYDRVQCWALPAGACRHHLRRWTADVHQFEEDSPEERISVSVYDIIQPTRHDNAIRQNRGQVMRSSGTACGLAAVLLLIAGCSSSGKSAAQTPEQTYTVVYEATGEGKAAAVVYIGSPGEKPKTQQSPTLPWTKEIKAKKGDYVSVSVVAEPDADLETGNINGAKMTCRITVDGKEMDSRSEDLNATCDFTLPLQ